MRSYGLAASLICADPLNVGRDVENLVRGGIDGIHFDVMDGVFVPRYGLPPEFLEALRQQTSVPVDAHLMVADPEPYVDTFVQAGADVITFHVEATNHAHRVAKRIRAAGVRAGVALNPATPIDSLEWLLDEVSLVLVMAINPGIVGHKLIPAMVDKVERIRAMIDARGLEIEVEVDGGVTFESAPAMVRAGATLLVCGSSTIFRPDEALVDKIGELREHLRESLA